MERDPRDFYPTPPECLTAALQVLEDHGFPLFQNSWTAFEPAAGTGNLTHPLKAFGATVTASDLHRYPGGVGTAGVDFLQLPPRTEYSVNFDMVVTNPPFSRALEFVEHAFTQGDRVMMLLRLSMLGSHKRFPFWNSIDPPSMIMLVPRPSFGLNRHGKKGSDNSEYAWFIWPTVLETLPPLMWARWKHPRA